MWNVIGALQSLGVPLPQLQRGWSFGLFSTLCIRAEEANDDIYNGEGRPDKVVVGGGSGFIGKEVCLQLRKAGYEVIVVSRKPGQYSWADIDKNGLPAGTKAVINLAGQNVLQPFSRWTPQFQQLCRSSRIETTRTLASAIGRMPRATRPNVFVTVSGVGYYAPSDAELDERAEAGTDWLAKLATDWEAATQDCGDNVRKVILRPGVVLGRTGGLIKQIYLPFFLGLGGRMGRGDQPFPWIHVKDLAGMIKFAVENERMDGVYNAVAPQIITNQNFVDAFAGALSRPAFFPLPDFVWNFVFGKERATMITEGNKVVPRRISEAGFKFKFPTIQAAAAEFSHLIYHNKDLKTV